MLVTKLQAERTALQMSKIALISCTSQQNMDFYLRSEIIEPYDDTLMV